MAPEECANSSARATVTIAPVRVMSTSGRTAGTRGRKTRDACLLSARHDELRAPVLGPRAFIVRRVEWKLFAVAHRTQPIRRDSERDEVGARGDGAALA